MIWKLKTESCAAVLSACDLLEELGLSLPVQLEGPTLVFDSDVAGSATCARDVQEVVEGLWDTDGEVIAVTEGAAA